MLTSCCPAFVSHVQKNYCELADHISSMVSPMIDAYGIDEIDKALRLLKLGKNTFNFIEGMVCKGGCIGGAASLTHEPKET